MSNSTRQGSADPVPAIPIEASRRGAHRARPNPWFGVLPAIAVAAVVVAVALVTYALFGRSPSSSSPSSAAATGSSVVATGTASAATGSVAASPSGQQPSGVAASSGGVRPSASAGQPSAAPGAVDRTITLHFFNGTNPNVPGASRPPAQKFTGLGWTVAPVAPWTGPPVTQTTIYYAKAEQKTVAATIAATLGVGTIKLSPARAGKGIAIVISNDYTP